MKKIIENIILIKYNEKLFLITFITVKCIPRIFIPWNILKAVKKILNKIKEILFTKIKNWEDKYILKLFSSSWLKYNARKIEKIIPPKILS